MQQSVNTQIANDWRQMNSDACQLKGGNVKERSGFDERSDVGLARAANSLFLAIEIIWGRKRKPIYRPGQKINFGAAIRSFECSVDDRWGDLCVKKVSIVQIFRCHEGTLIAIMLQNRGH
jgi:hypothetical protein